MSSEADVTGVFIVMIGKQQWRFAHPNDGYLAYNIPVNIVFCIEAIAETKTATGSWKVYSYDTEKARFQYSQNTVSASFPPDWPLFMLIIGKQQWGYATTIVTLPIAFIGTDYSIALTKADTTSGGAAEAWVAVSSKTTTQITWRGQWTTHIYWLAIGQQQIKRQH